MPHNYTAQDFEVRQLENGEYEARLNKRNGATPWFSVRNSFGYGYAKASGNPLFQDVRNFAQLTPADINGTPKYLNPETMRAVSTNPLNVETKALKKSYVRQVEQQAGIAVRDSKMMQPPPITSTAPLMYREVRQPDRTSTQYIVVHNQLQHNGDVEAGQFLNAIHKKLRENNGFAARVNFFTPTGAIYHRMLTGRTYADLKNSLSKMVVGDTKPGSDTLPDTAQIDKQNFSVLMRRVLQAGHYPAGVSTQKAPTHKHLNLWSCKTANPEKNNCLFDIVRTIANDFRKIEGKEPYTISTTSKKLRKVVEVAEDVQVPADIEIFNKLSLYLGYDIAVILDIAVLPDNQRVFRDDHNKKKNRNVCETRQVDIITLLRTENFPENERIIDICLINNHYCGIITDLNPGTLELNNVCPITGDLYNSDYGFSKDWKKDGKKTDYVYKRLLEQGREYLEDEPGRRIDGREQKKVSEKTPMTVKYIFFDFETIYDTTGELKPYSLGFAEFSQEELDEAATNSDFFADKIQKVRISKMKPGKSVCAPLLDLLEQAPVDVKYLLISFNGAAFDHLLLATAAANRNMLIDVFSTDNVLRTVKIGSMDRNKSNAHTTLDIAKILVGTSLDKACNDFNTNPKKVAGFDHWQVQKAYQAQGEEKFISFDGWLGQNQKEHDTYLIGDVLSLASLTIKCYSAVKQITGIDIFTSRSQTAAGIAFAYLKMTNKIPDAVKDIETDNFIRRSIIGGRTQVYKPLKSFTFNEETGEYNKGETEKGCFINGKLQMIDFASLYPTVMSLPSKYRENNIFDDNILFCEYPTSNEYVETTEYIPGKIGFYECKIISQPKYKVIPKRLDDGALDWDCDTEFIAVITHFDIELIRKYGGTLEVIKGIYFTTKSRDLMKEFIEPLTELKDKQDEYKEALDKGDIENAKLYNPALREFYKLLQNSCSGKFLQANYDDEQILARGLSEFYAAEKKLNPDAINYIPINENSTLIIGKRLNKAYIPSRAKPSYIGCLIYSYARGLLYRCCISPFLENDTKAIGPLYSDTDSMLLTESDCDKVYKTFPYLDRRGRKKERGDLDPELKQHKNANAYLIEKKDYVIIVSNEDEDPIKRVKLIEDNSKIRIKGVNRKRDKIITQEQASDIQKEIKKGEIYKCGEIYNSFPLLNIGSIEQVAKLRVEKTEEKKQKPYFMCSQLRKRFDTNGFYIDQVFMVKCLSNDDDNDE